MQQENTLVLLESYLKNIKQKVTVKTKDGRGHLSDWGLIAYRVQLSVNDLPGYIKPLKSILYSDDANTVISDKKLDNLVGKITKTLENINMLYKVNKS